MNEAPLKPDQEWANALTHGIAAVGAVIGGAYLVWTASSHSIGLSVACAAYMLSVLGTFFFSTLSHAIHRQPYLNRLRSWDQAMIYAMISGTYTPIAFAYAPDYVRTPLIAAIWIAATAGFINKVVIRHRVNSVGAVSYLLLGWLPAIPLAGHVPGTLVWYMIMGGVLYTVGILFLMNDHRIRYLHALWHISVIAAATTHYLGILHYVVEAA